MESNNTMLSEFDKNVLKRQLECVDNCEVVASYFHTLPSLNSPYTHRLLICVSDWKIGEKLEYDPPTFHIDMFYDKEGKIKYKITNYYLEKPPNVYNRKVLLEEQIERIIFLWCKDVFVTRGNES